MTSNFRRNRSYMFPPERSTLFTHPGIFRRHYNSSIKSRQLIKSQNQYAYWKSPIVKLPDWEYSQVPSSEECQITSSWIKGVLLNMGSLESCNVEVLVQRHITPVQVWASCILQEHSLQYESWNMKTVQSVHICYRQASCNKLSVPHNLPYITSSWYPGHYIKNKYHEHKSLYTVICIYNTFRKETMSLNGKYQNRGGGGREYTNYNLKYNSTVL
jgi:hypothetical protein